MSTTAVQDFRDTGPRLLRLDPLLLLATLGLIAASVYTVRRATLGDIPGDPNYYMDRQLIYIGVGLVLMLVLSRFDYSRLREWKLGVYGFMIAAILLVYALGFSARGSRRAIEFGFFNFQASELGKLLLVVALAGFAVDRARRLGERETTSRIVLLALIPAMLVVAQPDLGSGLVYLAIVLAVLFVAGTKWTHFAALAGLGRSRSWWWLLAAPTVGVEVIKPYQVDRLTAFLNPSTDPADEGYQINQSLTAIGSGGKTGRGDESTQTKLNFLPEHHTDFIFLGCWGGIRVRGSGARAVPVCAPNLESVENPDDVKELLRRTRRRRHHRDADVPGLRQRGHDHRDHAHHRHPAAADVLWRLVGAYDIDGHRPIAVDLRAGARDGCGQGPLTLMRRFLF